MDKKTLMKYLGSMQQAAGVRPVMYLEGRSSGMKAFEIRNGPLAITAMADKCLDVSEVSYRGINLNFLSKPGLQGRNHYDTNGDEAIRSIMGGFFFTAGLGNICAPCRIRGTDYPMHGRIRTTPAEHLSSDAVWIGDDYVLSVSGEMREASLFGENLVLRRTISTTYGTRTFTVKDQIENESSREEPALLLYHINIGYPFLSEQTKLYIPTRKVTARDEAARGHEDRFDRMEPPADKEPEYVFIHDLRADDSGRTQVLAVNPALRLGLRIAYNTANLSHFMEWKSVASGDYVLGLEPSNSSVFGRSYYEEHEGLHRLGPFEREEFELTFTVLDGEDEIGEAVRRYEETFPACSSSGKA